MSSHWTNKSAISRDLARLQGRVPVRVNTTVAAGDQPPDLKIEEETEEEFYRQGLGEGDFAPPELHRIQEMLELVRNQNVVDEDSNINYEISKANTKKSPNKAYSHATNHNINQASSSKPITLKTEESKVNKKSAKDIIEQLIGKEKQMNSPGSSSGSNTKPRRRNVAMESIMDSFNTFGIDNSKLSKVPETNDNPMKLLKPTDFQMQRSSEKVQNWFHDRETSSSYSYTPIYESSTSPEKAIIPSTPTSAESKKSHDKSPQTKELKTNANTKSEVKISEKPKVDSTWMNMDFNPLSMFKKKVKKVEETKVEATKPAEKPKPKSFSSSTNYVPSSMAQEYYKKYMIQQIIQEDIWMKVAERIDAIEEQKAAEAEKQRLLEEAEKQKIRLLEDALQELALILIDEAEEPKVIANEILTEILVDLNIQETETKASDSVITSETEPLNEQKFDIYLPVHRHLLSEYCIVCEVLCGKGNKKTEEKVIENWREKLE